jgi:hypothetical protein
MTSVFQRRRSLVFNVIITGLCLVIAGCNKEENASDALARIGKQVDGVPRCASLLSGSWPIEFSEHVLSGPRVDALVAAGLIRRVTFKRVDPLVAAGRIPAEEGDKRPRTRIEITSAGKPHVFIKTVNEDTPKGIVLCYGSVKVVSVRQKQQNVPAPSEPTKTTISDIPIFAYRIVQPPAWTARADIRAAFPFMVRDLEQLHSSIDSSLFGEYGYVSPDSGDFSADPEDVR